MRIFVTNVADRDLSRDLGTSIAAANFSFNLVEGAVFDKAYTILPAFVKGEIPSFKNKCIEPIYATLIRKSPLYKVAAVYEQFQVFKRIPKNASVWFYNVTPLNTFLIKLLRRLKPSVKIYIIILDFTPGSKLAVDSLPIINSADGRISLSTSSIFNQNNLCVLPGVVPINTEKVSEVTTISPDFLISGQLSDNISMLSTLLEVFANNPNLNLHITGIAPQKAIEYSKRYSNIICYGQVALSDYYAILQKCPFLLSTRDPEFLENLCNFPSKIIEGLLHNRIIISTIDYPQLGDIKYLKVDSTNLEVDLKQISSMRTEDLISYANQKEAVQQAFSTKIWENTMLNCENCATKAN